MTEQNPTAHAFDVQAFLAEVQRPEHYIWREVEREGDASPLRIKVLDLTTSQTEAIPWGSQVKLRDSYQAIAPYVVEWDLQAKIRKTGELVPVPPPAEAGWEVFELLTNFEGSNVVNWLKIPHFMRAQQDTEKKSSTPSTSTSGRPKRKS